MLTLTTDRYPQQSISGWNRIHNLFARVPQVFSSAAPSTVTVQSAEENLAMQQASLAVPSRLGTRQAQSVRPKVALTDAQVEALELALRQGSVNAPNELFA